MDSSEYTQQKPNLYQYTSLDGLVSIARTKSLWLSHILYQNDLSEYYYGIELIKKIMQKECKYGAPEFLDVFLQHRNYVQVFTASFSTKPDSLSQWRGYCPKGGCSFALQSETLDTLLKHPSLAIQRCLYTESEQQDYIRKLIVKYEADKIYHNGVNKVGGSYDRNRHAPDNLLRFSVASAAALFKNEKFEDESEWRIIASKVPNLASRPISEIHSRVANFPDAYEKIDFRPGVSTLIPYVSIPLEQATLPGGHISDSAGSLFKEITLSPGPSAELAEYACKMFAGYGCTVKQSAIPYKNW